MQKELCSISIKFINSKLMSEINVLEEHMQRHAIMCEDAIANADAEKMVEHTTAIARLANRVLQVANQEAENSEDPYFINKVKVAADRLQNCKYCFK